MQKVRHACRNSESTTECPTAFEGQPHLLGTREPERHQEVLLFSHGPCNPQYKEQKQLSVHRQLGVLLVSEWRLGLT